MFTLKVNVPSDEDVIPCNNLLGIILLNNNVMSICVVEVYISVYNRPEYNLLYF